MSLSSGLSNVWTEKMTKSSSDPPSQRNKRNKRKHQDLRETFYEYFSDSFQLYCCRPLYTI